MVSIDLSEGCAVGIFAIALFCIIKTILND
ncbi:hypothetical protein EMGBS15_12060 [Filimonas sp.]|nr:hypothetical protein EMGBS15_12060 [Filimonas sp.]